MVSIALGCSVARPPLRKAAEPGISYSYTVYVKHGVFIREPATADLVGPLALPACRGQINLEVR